MAVLGPNCFKDIRTIFGIDLPNIDMTKEVNDEIAKLVKKNGSKNIGMLTQQLYNYLANQGSQWAAVEAAAKKRNLVLQTQRNLANFQWVSSTFREKEWQGLYALLTGSEKLKEGSQFSVDAVQQMFQRYYQGGFAADLFKLGREHINIITAHKEDFDRQITKALASLSDPNVNFTGDAKFLDIARVMHKWQEISVADANRNGAFIGTLPGYIIQQNHNSFQLESVDVSEWVSDIYSKLNWDKTADGAFSAASQADREAFLSGIYMNIIGKNPMDTGKNPLAHHGSGRIGSTANKMSQGRVLHFLDSDAWFDYNKKYGDGNLLASYMNSLRRMANDTGIMKVLGPSPEAGLDALKNALYRAMNKSMNKKGFKNMSRWNGKIDNVFKEVSGKVNAVDSPTLAWIGSTIRALQDMVKLGGATISSFTDIAGIGSEMSYQGGDFFGSILSSATDIIYRAGTKEEQMQLMKELGVAIDTFLGDIVARASGETGPGKLADFHRKFFKLNLLTQWTDACRKSAGALMAATAARERKLMFHQLPKQKQRIYGTYGIKDWEWNEIIRNGQTTKFADGSEFLTPEAIAGTSDADIAKVLTARGENPDPMRIENYRIDLTERFRTYFSRRVQYAVLEPNAGTRAFLRQGTIRGSVPGEVARFFAQFKSFPTAFVRQVLGREFYGRMGEKGWGVSSTLSLVRLITTMTALGYVSMSLKQMAKGLSPRDPKDPETWIAAMVQGGGAGILGDFMFGQANRFGHGFTTTILGPTFGTFADLYDIYAHVREGEGKAKEIYRFVMNNMPLMNLFYVKEPFNYLFGYSLMEKMDKGSFRRMQNRLKKDTRQTYWYKKFFDRNYIKW